MATANHTTSADPRSRRTLLAAVGAAAALPTSAVPQPVPAAGADAELLELCAAWRRAFDREMAVLERLGRMLERDWSDEDRASLAEASAEVYRLEDLVFDTPATTLAGVKAKASVLDYLDAAADIPAEREYAASLVADIMALGGAL